MSNGPISPVGRSSFPSPSHLQSPALRPAAESGSPAPTPGGADLSDMAGFRAAVDIGGTFTDVVFLGDDGRVLVRKVRQHS